MSQNGLAMHHRYLQACLVVGLWMAFQADAAEVPKRSGIPQGDGAALARVYCVQCHALPVAAHLDRRTWEAELLPKMRYLAGLEPPPTNGYFKDLDLLLEAGVFPKEPRIPEHAFEAIAAHYLRTAPAQLPAGPADGPSPAQLTQFTPVPAPARRVPQLTPLALVDPHRRVLIVGDVTSQGVDFLEPDGAQIGSLPLNNIPTAAVIRPDALWFGCIGHFFPREEPRGQVIRMLQRPGSFHRQVLAEGLPRIADLDVADLNGDGREDFVVCGFGNLIGRLSWFAAGTNDVFKELVLLAEPGAVQCEIRDLDGNGTPDLAVLQAQARERLLFFLNDGRGNFRSREVFQRDPGWGHSGFCFADMDGDGMDDLVVTNGDNADFHTSPPRPHHGIRILRNRGGHRYDDWLFLLLPGAYKAVVRDFDGDGDPDIAAVSFFPDYEDTPQEGFVYFNNEGTAREPRFVRQTHPAALLGRWITLDAGDVDGDGDEDLVLGSLVGMPTAVPPEIRRLWEDRGPSVMILRNLRIP
ncbi:MAG: VCBS repeat-containing protein [Verrucomicrobiae bacterium]|nr:VCBS repeat-containing protein [Verrucomicrobiae bacterium]